MKAANGVVESMDVDPDLDEEDEEEDDDPVVRSLDVFLSQNLPGVRDPSGSSAGLFLFQYPLRPKWRPLDDGWQLNKVSYRPLNQMVEMELTSEETGDEFVHKLASSNVNPRSSYAVGLLRGEQLHLTPLQGVLQFRPRFDHKDEEDTQKKKASNAAQGAGAEEGTMKEEGSGSDTEQVLSAVQVRVHKRESDKAKEIWKSSHAYMKQQEEKEAWKTVSFLGPDAEESKTVLESLISTSRRDIEFQSSSIDYLSALNAITKLRDDALPAQTAEPSREQIVRLPLAEQIRAFMSGAQVLQYERLVELVPKGDRKRQEILSALPHMAVLVQGNWVVKSDLLFKDSSGSQHAIQALQRCRNHILANFTHSVRINANELHRHIVREVPQGQLVGMLMQVAVRKEGYWEFRLPPDSDFIRDYPQIHAAQQQQWAALEAATAPAVVRQQSTKSDKGKGGRGSQSRENSGAGGGPGGGAGAGEGGKGREGAAAAKKKSQEKGDAEGVEAKAGGGGEGPTAMEVEGDAGGVGLSGQIRSQLVAFVTQTVKELGVCDREELFSRLAEHPNAKLAQLGGTGGGEVEAWARRAVDECVDSVTEVVRGRLVLRRVGAAWDGARSAVIEAFKHKAGHSKRDLTTAAQDATGEVMNVNVFTRITRELTTLKGGMYVFKGETWPPEGEERGGEEAAVGATAAAASGAGPSAGKTSTARGGKGR